MNVLGGKRNIDFRLVFLFSSSNCPLNVERSIRKAIIKIKMQYGHLHSSEKGYNQKYDTILCSKNNLLTRY